MDMEKRLDMSLDDVIKQNAKQTAGKGRGQERNGKVTCDCRLRTGNTLEHCSFYPLHAPDTAPAAC